jgi:hypothetical protein
VPKLRNLFAAVIVLTLWLGATQHCNLEAAEIFGAHDAHDTACCPNSTGGCHADGCKVVESAAYRGAEASDLSVAADVTAFCWVLRPAPSIPPTGDALALAAKTSIERLHPWVPIWHFDRRTVANPGAPSCPVV